MRTMKVSQAALPQVRPLERYGDAKVSRFESFNGVDAASVSTDAQLRLAQDLVVGKTQAQIEALLALTRVRHLFDGTTPVTTKTVARLIGCSALAVDNVLKRAAYSGRIREVRGRGWLPLAR